MLITDPAATLLPGRPLNGTDATFKMVQCHEHGTPLGNATHAKFLVEWASCLRICKIPLVHMHDAHVERLAHAVLLGC